MLTSNSQCFAEALYYNLANEEPDCQADAQEVEAQEMEEQEIPEQEGQEVRAYQVS